MSANQGPWGLPHRLHPPPPQLPPGIARLLSVGVFAAAAVAGLLFGSFYVVQPTEMAAVRRFGTVITTQPVGPGLHVKLPFVDTVDRSRPVWTPSSSRI